MIKPVTEKEMRLKELLNSLTDIIGADVATLHPQRGREDLTEEACVISGLTKDRVFFNGEDLLALLKSNLSEFKRLNRGVSWQGRQVYGDLQFGQFKLYHPWIRRLSDQFSLHSCLFTTVSVGSFGVYVFTFYSKKSDFYSADNLLLVRSIEDDIAASMEQLLKQSIAPVSKDTNYPGGNAEPTPDPFEGIIGASDPIRQVLNQVRILGSSDTSTVIYGESGTGKEKIARAIHQLSHRVSRPMITVNCGALPANLIESELFGYEKGAFTGAVERRIGKFEQAKGGTIFQDEIGELPLELQVKLLRALQEKEIERLGGNQTVRLDVRIVAATNRNITGEVEARRFRKDLSYRLNTYPIVMPPLRQRKDDIPLLAAFFLARFAPALGKAVSRFSVSAIAQMTSYD